MNKNILLSLGLSVSLALPSTTLAASPTCRLQEQTSFHNRGPTVMALQDFLRSQKLFHIRSTGYFGPITQAALK